MTDAQTIRDLADLLERSVGVDVDRLRKIADKLEVSNRIEHALGAIVDELIFAEKKWPVWPIDPIHAAGVLAEEAGECVRAANRFYYEGQPIEEVKKEAAQTGAMAIRTLLGLDQYIKKPDTEPDICGACSHWLSEGWQDCPMCGKIFNP